MKKVLFVASHIGSGSDYLCRILNENPRVQWHRTESIYNHPEVAFSLTDAPHKCTNVSAVWMDDILDNSRFNCPALHRRSNFIYLIREPAQSLAAIVAAGMRPEVACRYYVYRLRRICQMAARTPNAVLLTFEDLINQKGFPLVEQLLNLKNKLQANEAWLPQNKDAYSMPLSIVADADRSYEEHLYHMRELSQRHGRPLAVPRRENNASSNKLTVEESSVAN